MKEEAQDRYPWTRRPDTAAGRGESSQAYAAFRVYMLMPTKDRSVKGAAESEGRADSLWRRWSKQWDWVNRAAAYDTYMTTAAIDERVDELVVEFDQVRNSQLQLAGIAMAQLRANAMAWKPGFDPSIRWTTAFTAVAKVQFAALTMRAPSAATDDETIARIMEIMSRKAEG